MAVLGIPVVLHPNCLNPLPLCKGSAGPREGVPREGSAASKGVQRARWKHKKEGAKLHRVANQKVKKSMKKAKEIWIEEQCQDIENNLQKNKPHQ